MKSVWSDWVPSSPIDREAFLYMGSDPVWTPAREFKRPGAPDASSGLCSECGGDGGFPLIDANGQPILDADGFPVVLTEVPVASHRICARCMRSGSDQHSQGIPSRAVSPTPTDSGYISTPNGSQVPGRFARLVKG